MSPQYGTIDCGDCQSLASKDKIRSHLDFLLLLNKSSGPVDWNVVSGLLQDLENNDDASPAVGYTSIQDDPMGRLLMKGILVRDPPLAIVDTAIHIYPESLKQNPCAFLVASQHSSPEVLTRMIRQVAPIEDQCPYPWIISEQVPLASAKLVLEAFPGGVWKSSSFLSSHNLVDFLLMSPEVVQRRTLDHAMWAKFKLVLVAAGCSDKDTSMCCPCEIAPVQVILKRILSRSDFWDDRFRVEHVLWLLHQLRWTDRWVFEKATYDGKFPIHLVLSYKCTADRATLVAARALIQVLLEAHPASASRRVSGKLALHMAVENGWPCHDLLLAAYPEALDAPDPLTELYPFQAAAKHHQLSSYSVSLDMAYDLLRANPCNAGEMSRERTRLRANG